MFLSEHYRKGLLNNGTYEFTSLLLNEQMKGEIRLYCYIK